MLRTGRCLEYRDSILLSVWKELPEATHSGSRNGAVFTYDGGDCGVPVGRLSTFLAEEASSTYRWETDNKGMGEAHQRCGSRVCE